MEEYKRMMLTSDLEDIFKNAKGEIVIPESREALLEMVMGGQPLVYDVDYEVEGRGTVREVTVTKCRNGVVVNYDDVYMRRRDPNSMVIADKLPTDKVTHEERFGKPFDDIREEALNWLKNQEKLICIPFNAGNDNMEQANYPALLIAPANAAFFAYALTDLQGMIPLAEIPDYFKPRAVVYVVPPFRHTHYGGKQVVIHNRGYNIHEVFSFNLYPGPSAKKGIYAVLLDIGEQEKWLTLHASTVRAVTPYELQVVIMHEGASGGGKSEMLEQIERQRDGRVLLARNLTSGEKHLFNLSDACELHPVTDDMAICHPSLQNDSGRVVCADAENGWFVRVNHIEHYGMSPELEHNSIHPPRPFVFMNMDAVPGSTCLIWEPIMDDEVNPCPNPRVIMPRSFNKLAVDGAVEVNVRSFGLRQPPSTKENPSYGITGMFHVLPPALAWLWRVAAPRGYGSPSIVSSEGLVLESEGVGSYWPFTTGKRVNQANLLLEQILRTPQTRFILIPNQHIGNYYVGFSAEWLTREYIARRGGARFNPENLTPSRCPILGYSPVSVKIDGVFVPKPLLQTNLQPELTNEGYDAGAAILTQFFNNELSKYLTPDLQSLGRQIITAFMEGARVDDYEKIIPMK
ncbi:MAG: DUF4914 family protein [Defluviitaleaceae bacterium]|nr:DUF4914 family protein [Defluviitaleaceae bacterium]